MTQIKPNRRVKKTINKTYRLHQTDIWGALGRVSQDKKITKFVASANRSQLISELRKYPRNISKQIKQRVLWANKKATKNLFLYQLTQIPQRRKAIKKTLRTTILKTRKKLLLFYFASRIRAKTFRRFSKLYLERAYSSPDNKIGKNNFLSYVGYKTFTLFLEARLDVLFLRVNFLPTMYAIRQALFHRKGNVKGQTPLNQPGFLVKAFREFSGEREYLKFFEPHLLKNKESLNKKYDHPVYVWPSNTIKKFFKVFEPLGELIKYPFDKGSPLVLKYASNKHFLLFLIICSIFNLDWTGKKNNPRFLPKPNILEPKEKPSFSPHISKSTISDSSPHSFPRGLIYQEFLKNRIDSNINSKPNIFFTSRPPLFNNARLQDLMKSQSDAIENRYKNVIQANERFQGICEALNKRLATALELVTRPNYTEAIKQCINQRKTEILTKVDSDELILLQEEHKAGLEHYLTFPDKVSLNQAKEGWHTKDTFGFAYSEELCTRYTPETLSAFININLTDSSRELDPLFIQLCQYIENIHRSHVQGLIEALSDFSEEVKKIKQNRPEKQDISNNNSISEKNLNNNAMMDKELSSKELGEGNFHDNYVLSSSSFPSEIIPYIFFTLQKVINQIMNYPLFIPSSSIFPCTEAITEFINNHFPGSMIAFIIKILFLFFQERKMLRIGLLDLKYKLLNLIQKVKK